MKRAFRLCCRLSVKVWILWLALAGLPGLASLRA